MDEKFYVYKGIYIYMYMYTCKQSLHESSCCKVDKRHVLWSSVMDTTVLDYTDLCVCALVPLRARCSERHENLHQSFLHTSPFGTSTGEKCSLFNLFLSFGVYFCGVLFGFFFNLVFGCGVTFSTRNSGKYLGCSTFTKGKM